MERAAPRRLERDLLAAGQSIVRVSPKLMAHARDAARTYGKSDPIDALAVARAAQREPGLPVARLDGPDRDVRLLTDHRESLVAERTRVICRLRWHLHELDPAWEPKTRSLDRITALDQVDARIAGLEGTVARLARLLADHPQGRQESRHPARPAHRTRDRPGHRRTLRRTHLHHWLAVCLSRARPARSWLETGSSNQVTPADRPRHRPGRPAP